MPRTTIVAAAIAITVAGRAALAQPAPPAGDTEAEARAHFKRAEAHYDKRAWREALDEYRQSLALKTTKAAMANAATCLKALGQYDEALDLYEDLRREFPVLPPKMEAAVGPAMAELQRLVGTLVVAGDAPTGASLFVDDRRRGTLPLAAPLRLSVGTHTVRVEKEGFEPIVTSVRLDPARENVARLQSKAPSGRLRVSELHHQVLDVELDGRVVGKTPWEGVVPVGEHQVRVHGFVRVDALGACTVPAPDAAAPEPGATDRAELGSAKVAASVRLYEATSLSLTAEELDALLRVEATPASAAVSIDGTLVSLGTWEGRLPLGAHTVEVAASGFLPVRKEVRIERRKQPDLHIDLLRVPKLGAWGPKRAAAVGTAYAIGAAGLTVSAIAGTSALVTIAGVRSKCDTTSLLCPTSQKASADRAVALATASTVALVVGGAGLVAGTVLVFRYRPDERSPAASLGLGLGRVAVEGRF